MTSQFDCEPWYQVVSMGHEEARTQLFNVFKFKIEDHKILRKVINEIVHDKIEMGSIRGYWTFQHNIFKLAIQERLDYINRKIN